MAKNARKNGAIKARETKLGKKNNEDLIQIILRKDSIEAKLNNNIKQLKAENNNLSSRINNFDEDMKGTIESLSTYKAKCTELSTENTDYKTIVDEYETEIVQLYSSLKWRKVLNWILIATSLILLMLNWF